MTEKFSKIMKDNTYPRNSENKNVDKYKYTLQVHHSQTSENQLQNKSIDGKKTQYIQSNKN